MCTCQDENNHDIKSFPVNQVSTLGPGGRRVPQPVRALSKKLPRGVTSAATRGVTAVNSVLAKGSGWKERLGQQLRDANLKQRAQQTIKV